MAEYGDGSDGEGAAAAGLAAADRRRIGSVVTAARAAAAWGRRSGSGLLLDQPFPHRLHLGDPLLVAGGIDVRIGLRVGLQLLVLAGQVEEPAVRPEEHIGGGRVAVPYRPRPLGGGGWGVSRLKDWRVVGEGRGRRHHALGSGAHTRPR